MSTALSDPLVGQLLDGRYRVTRRLARGGMATVYTALDTRLGREVALKVMHPSLATDREFVSRFIREAHSAARLSHPAAVAVYDQGADSGHVFIAMEYVPGRTLRDWLRERGRLTPRETFAVLEPVLAALATAHAAGLVHRDVKPENVLIADDGRVKVADFGLARAVTNATVTGTLIGTVAYLSPEQVDRGTADQRSDVYAAGILLYECLTGHQPHYGETPLQIAYQHVNSDVPAPSSTRPTLAREIDDLVRRATCRNADGRPADAGEFLRELLAVRRALRPEALDDVAGADAPTVVVSRQEAAQYRTPAQPTIAFETGAGVGVGVGGILPPTAAIAAPPRFGRRRTRGRLSLAAVVLLAAALGVGGWQLAADNSVTTPSLLNLSKDAALIKAHNSGLQVRFADTGQFSENVEAGEVLSTDPLPGHPVAKHGWVTVVLSKGPERITVPASVAGAGLDDAKQQLIDAGLSPGTVKHTYSDTVAAGQVMSTDPAVGSSLKRNTVVNLVVSDGGKPTAVPNVVGDSVDDATATLQDAGFKVTIAQVNSGADTGTVIGESPSPDQKAPHNSTITLQVSSGSDNGSLVTVPNLVGMSRDQAEEVLRRMNLDSDTSNFGFGDKVTAQDPRPGTQVPSGTDVHLTYSFF